MEHDIMDADRPIPYTLVEPELDEPIPYTLVGLDAGYGALDGDVD